MLIRFGPLLRPGTVEQMSMLLWSNICHIYRHLMVNLRERNLCGKWSSGQVQTTFKNGIDRIYCRYSPKKVFLQHFPRDFARLLQGENDSHLVDNFVRLCRNTTSSPHHSRKITNLQSQGSQQNTTAKTTPPENRTAVLLDKVYLVHFVQHVRNDINWAGPTVPEIKITKSQGRVSRNEVETESSCPIRMH